MSGAGARTAWTAVFGIALGFTLSRVGFTDYDAVHAMFTLADLRLILVFAGALALTALGIRAVSGQRWLGARPIHRGTVVGSVLFGVGWALTGACPGVIFAQLGEGQIPALASFSGAIAGTILFRVVNARYLRWDRGVCA